MARRRLPSYQEDPDQAGRDMPATHLLRELLTLRGLQRQVHLPLVRLDDTGLVHIVDLLVRDQEPSTTRVPYPRLTRIQSTIGKTTQGIITMILMADPRHLSIHVQVILVTLSILRRAINGDDPGVNPYILYRLNAAASTTAY